MTKRLTEAERRDRIDRFCWEWESGDGYTAWGTHDPVTAHKWMYWVMVDVYGFTLEDVLEYLPDLSDVKAYGRKVWINTRAYRDADENNAAWKGHKHWAPWRTKAYLFSN